MATRSWVPSVGGLLALTTLFGVLAVYGTPDGSSGIGVWPVALASAVLLVSPKPATRVVLGCGLRDRLPDHLER